MGALRSDPGAMHLLQGRSLQSLERPARIFRIPLRTDLRGGGASAIPAFDLSGTAQPGYISLPKGLGPACPGALNTGP